MCQLQVSDGSNRANPAKPIPKDTVCDDSQSSHQKSNDRFSLVYHYLWNRKNFLVSLIKYIFECARLHSKAINTYLYVLYVIYLNQ